MWGWTGAGTGAGMGILSRDVDASLSLFCTTNDQVLIGSSSARGTARMPSSRLLAKSQVPSSEFYHPRPHTNKAISLSRGTREGGRG